MKREDINIRDPFILLDQGKYYLYGTRSASCWGPADGFDVYVSDNLEEFEGPIEIFHRPDDFFATEAFWAPECYHIGNYYYLLTTFGGNDIKKGLYFLISDSPTGPFMLHSKRLTPESWTCIDGTLFVENEKIYMIYSRSFEDALEPDLEKEEYNTRLKGSYCLVEINADLTESIGEPTTLFYASDAKWARSVPFAYVEFGINDPLYFSDGPFITRNDDGSLQMIFSSWSDHGYAIGTAISQSGICGPWELVNQPLFPENGGHGMIFTDKNNEKTLVLHFPNDKFLERPSFIKLE